ncbi:hypothetical protein I553_3588 [Mycobacterium xenopi 4042]|uniref:Uncharacterized protein n=1 Tax=Mycobacterium xenopi 4042 TaxID=1299334 RepID=X8DIF8_MYCXE|nr:hypothetical protein I553_3588 [Mycobacterium xenopi 4042]
MDGDTMRRSRSGVDGYDGLHMPRSRGAITGLLLVLLGAWGALIPFVGHTWTSPTRRTSPGRGPRPRLAGGIPGVTTLVGGLLLIGSGNRATAMFGGWLASFAGAWFVVGGALASTCTSATSAIRWRRPTASGHFSRLLTSPGWER